MVAIRNLLRALFRHDATDREMHDEMQAHLARAAERLVARGMSPRDAALAARREFGNLGLLAEQGRDARGASWIETLRGDVRYGLRALRNSPVFSAVAILSLAVGIGANTAIFSLINAVILKPLPVAHPEELVQVRIRDSVPASPQSLGNAYFTNPIWERLRDETTPYASYAVSDFTQFSLVSGGEMRSARGAFVNGEYFATLGVRALLGRTLITADDHPGCSPVAVLGEAFWRSELGGAGDVVGRTIALEGKQFTIVGVVPRAFFGVDVGTVQQVYVPLCSEALVRGASSALAARSTWWLRILARPRPGVSRAELAERLRMVSRPVMEASLPPSWDAQRRAQFTSGKFSVQPVRNGLSSVREQYTVALRVLMGMVGLILLIACANVANLMLARAASRSREVAVRIAIGASRGRILRQLLTEAALVAAAGTVAGVGIASWATRFLVGMLSTSRNEVMLDLAPDLRILAFTAGTAILTVLLFGLGPAWRATRIDPQAAMKSGGRGTADGFNRFRVGKALVVAQSALALVLVIGAGLLVTTFARLSTTNLGFSPEGILVAQVRLPATIARDQRRPVFDRMRGQIEALPGVQSVSNVSVVVAGGSSWNDEVVIESDPSTVQRPALVWFNAAGPGYFQTMRTRVIAGREFGSEDTPTSLRVAVVNQAAARSLFKGGVAVGQFFHTVANGKSGDRTLVVGVVEDSPYRTLRSEPEPVIFLADRQSPAGSAVEFVIRGSSAPDVVSAVKQVAGATDPGILLTFTRLEDQLSESLQRERALALLSSAFGGLALLLAMMGLYGVLAYTLARRRVEIGIRIALGAAAGRVVRLVMADVAVLVGTGMVIGLAVAAAGARVLGSLLYGVQARDPITMAGAALLLGVVALVAGAVPARRAASLQPVEALRED